MDREAEGALLGVLELEPNHREARQNLSVLRARRSLKPDEEITLEALLGAECGACEAAASALLKLKELSRGCEAVTEIGAGRGEATVAILSGRPARLVCYDMAKAPELDLLGALAGKTAFEFRPGDEPPEIEETDLLVVRGRDDSDSVARLLRRHSPKVRKYVAVLGPGATPDLLNGDFRPRPDAVASAIVVFERTASSAPPC
jgi:hypothetical protein